MSSWSELSQRRKENPYFDWLSFYLVMPTIWHSPYKSIEHNLSGIADQGHWSEGLAKRIEAIYATAAGTQMQDHNTAVVRLKLNDRTAQPPEPVQDLKQCIRRGLNLISYYLRGVNTCLRHEHFDLDLFHQQFIKIYTAYGSETTRWFCLNYADVLKANYDPVEYVRCIYEVAKVGGRESISIFSAGFRPLMVHESHYSQRTEPGPFVSAINRIIEKTGSRWYALTFALSSRYALAHELSLEELETRITDWGQEFDPQLTKKITNAFFEFYRVSNHESEYDFAALEADVRILQEKFDSKIAAWYIDGVIHIRRAKERGLYELARAKRELQDEEKIGREAHEEWRREMLELAARLGVERDIPSFDEYQSNLEIKVAQSEAGLPLLTPEHFREVFGSVLDDLGRQAAYLYAYVSFDEFNGYSSIDLDKVIEGYISEVGQRFAKRSLWLLLKITSGSPESLREIIPQLITVVKTEGEKVAHDQLKYSYGARHRGSHAGLIKPGLKKTDSESQKDIDDPEPPLIDDPWTDSEFDSHSGWDSDYEQE